MKLKKIYQIYLLKDKINQELRLEQERQQSIKIEIQKFLIKDGSNPENVKKLTYGFYNEKNIVIATNKQ